MCVCVFVCVYMCGCVGVWGRGGSLVAVSVFLLLKIGQGSTPTPIYILLSFFKEGK